MKTIIYGASIRGNGHYVNGRECQDNNSFQKDDLKEKNIKVISLGDGHGGDPYVRSAVGSRFACDISKRLMTEFIKSNVKLLDELDEINIKLQDLKNVNKYSKLDEEICLNKIDFYKEIIEVTDEYQLLNKKVESSKTFQKKNFYKNKVTKLLETLSEDQIKTLKTNHIDGVIKLLNENIDNLKVITESLKKFDETNFDKLSSRKNNLENSLYLSISKLKENILNEWTEAVFNDLKNDPVSVGFIKLFKNDNLDIETKTSSFVGYIIKKDHKIDILNKKLDEKILEKVIKNPKELYGSTLLCIGQYKNHNFAFQLGDGDCITIDKDGKGEFVFEELDEQIANESNSLCQRTALSRIQFKYFYKPLKMFMISTDGVVNGMTDPKQLLEIGSLIHESINEEPIEFKTELKPLLRKFSGNSSDDCTICFIANDIKDDSFNTFNSAKEVEEINNLEETFIPLYKPFKASNAILALEDGTNLEPNDIEDKLDYQLITKHMVRSSINKFSREISQVKANKSAQNTVTLSAKMQMMIYGHLKRTPLEEVQFKISKDYKQQVINYFIENPIYCLECQTKDITVDDNGIGILKDNSLDYGLVKTIDKNTITFASISGDNYNLLANDIDELVLYEGTITLKDKSTVDVENYDIIINFKGEK